MLPSARVAQAGELLQGERGKISLANCPSFPLGECWRFLYHKEKINSVPGVPGDLLSNGENIPEKGMFL